MGIFGNYFVTVTKETISFPSDKITATLLNRDDLTGQLELKLAEETNYNYFSIMLVFNRKSIQYERWHELSTYRFGTPQEKEQALENARKDYKKYAEDLRKENCVLQYAVNLTTGETNLEIEVLE